MGRVVITVFAVICVLNFATESPSARAAPTGGKEHGAALFQEKGCAYCHGARGIGGGKGPDLRFVRKKLKKDQIAHQIAQGGGAMPAFGATLDSKEISDLVAFLRSKRK